MHGTVNIKWMMILLLKKKVENYALCDVVCRLYQGVLFFKKWHTVLQYVDR